jgi:hypothetical protein
MRVRLPVGSLKAQSRIPYGWSVGSWTSSVSPAWSRSKVPSTSFGQVDAGEGPPRLDLGDSAALVFGDAPGRRVLDDGRARLLEGTNRDPVYPSALDVVANLDAEAVAMEGDGCLRTSWGRKVAWIMMSFMTVRLAATRRPSLLDS